MSINIEQVEKLKERADITYGEAKNALEQCDGNLLEAMIYLEKQGKVKADKLGSYDSRLAESASPANPGGSGGSGGGGGEQRKEARSDQKQRREGSCFGDAMREIWRFVCRVVRAGNENHFEVYRAERCVLKVPVTLLVLCLVFLFYVTLPVLILALFFGCRYRFRGPELGKETINHVMDDAAEAAENLKRAVQDKVEPEEDSARK